ncbi:protein Shroom2-like [Aplochiton taeniatus]
MDIIDYRNDLRISAEKVKWFQDVDRWKTPIGLDLLAPDHTLVNVLLTGGAPWGFTLRGGIEHREPLIITKVEEGRQAAVSLQVGDELVNVNTFPLSGSRQEAICLVKSSYQSLALLVRRRSKMVDIVSQTMPSENDVHVARNFLTKILRSSMRKNRFKGKSEPASRPHSWHSPKVTEGGTEPTVSQAAPADIWQPKHEARSSSKEELSTCGDQPCLQQMPSGFSSTSSSMEKLERPPSHPCTQGRLSPTKFTSPPEPHCGSVPSVKRESSFSCFSVSTSPPLPDPTPDDASAETLLYKGLPGEGPRQSERPRHPPIPVGNGSWEGPRSEDQPGNRFSAPGKFHVGPVWHVPERKKPSAPSPPPPAPPTRSDSFAATKGHEAGRSHVPPPPKKDLLHPSSAADHNQLPPSKLLSLSSTDVRQGPSPATQPPHHQRQRSEESPFYLQTRASPQSAKPQSVASYYRSLQDLPANVPSKPGRSSMACLSGSSVDHLQEHGGHIRYYCIMNLQPGQTGPPARQGPADGRRGEKDATPHWGKTNDRSSSNSAKVDHKVKYPLQPPLADGKERSGRFRAADSAVYEHLASGLAASGKGSGAEEKDGPRRTEGLFSDIQRFSYGHHAAAEHRPCPPRERLQDPWVPQEDRRISPQKTPLLHSLTQERRSLAEKKPPAAALSSSAVNAALPESAAANGKLVRRSDRYATTLRHEIQLKRAQLQKSRSAAALSCPAEEEDRGGWSFASAAASAASAASSSDGSFSNSYKDHLKEAQARVLQATSFQRRDLEPPGADATAGYSNGALARIGGRKRFSADKRLHSYSEPDKIHKVGVEGERSSGSFGERRRFFEAKPAFPRPTPKPGHQSPGEDQGGAGEVRQRVRSGEHHPGAELVPDSPTSRQAWMEKQRLGTFAEYQATWSMQRKNSDSKTQGKGKYHSAENILDAEEKTTCVHERSRSSPSADFYGQTFFLGRDSSLPLPLHSDIRPKPDPGSHPGNTLSPSAHDHSHSPCSWMPRSKPQSAQQTQDLLPPRLKTTSSSQECLPGTQPEPAAAAAQPQISTSSSSHPGTQRDPTQAGSSAKGSSLAASPCPGKPSGASGLDKGRMGEEVGAPLTTDEPPPPSALSSKAAALSVPTTDGSLSPSPSLSPPRPTNRLPASMQESSQGRPENGLGAGMEENGSGNAVPVRVVLPESRSQRQKEDHHPQYLQQGGARAPGGPDNSSPPRPRGAGPPEQANAQSRAYTQPSPPGAEAVFLPIRGPPDPGLSGGVNGAPDGGQPSEEEDQKREELVRDIMDKDKSLVDILDQSRMRTTMDLMEGIFPQGQKLLEGSHQRRKAGSKQAGSPRGAEDRREQEGVCASASLVPSSSYYSTSAPKAELLIKMKDLQDQREGQDEEDEDLDLNLASKKQELIDSLSQKLEVLREARESLQEDVEDNDALGQEVEATVQQVCKPNQLDKFRMFVGDLDKVVSLLLSLSGRLARVENALNSLEEDASPEEKRTLTEKRKLLIRQHEDAKELKENLDRRERLVYGIMAAHLGPERLADYQHFVKMKSALIIEQRKLDDKMKLGEEQLRGLMDSLPQEQRAT